MTTFTLEPFLIHYRYPPSLGFPPSPRLHPSHVRFDGDHGRGRGVSHSFRVHLHQRPFHFTEIYDS